MLDLTPATEMVTRVVADIGDDQLGGVAPGGGSTVADLLDHLDGLCLAFTAAAAKDLAAGSQAPSADGSRLGPEWRMRISGRLAQLASAWQDETAWEGMTRVGGVDLPGEVAARVAIDEVVVHGWDLAAATGHDYAGEDRTGPGGLRVRAVRGRAEPGRERGTVRPAGGGAGVRPLLDRLIGLTGRDPAWKPAGGN